MAVKLKNVAALKIAVLGTDDAVGKQNHSSLSHTAIGRVWAGRFVDWHQL